VYGTNFLRASRCRAISSMVRGARVRSSVWAGVSILLAISSRVRLARRSTGAKQPFPLAVGAVRLRGASRVRHLAWTGKEAAAAQPNRGKSNEKSTTLVAHDGFNVVQDIVLAKRASGNSLGAESEAS
jgi:hypothetical protein